VGKLGGHKIGGEGIIRKVNKIIRYRRPILCLQIKMTVKKWI